MKQVNHQQVISELSVEEKIGREQQLASQLPLLRDQLATIRKNGPVNGIGEEDLVALINQHEAGVAELSDLIDQDINPETLKGQAVSSAKVKDYLARQGKIHHRAEVSSRPSVDGLSQRELQQIKSMNESVAPEFFTQNRLQYPTFQSYLDDTAEQKAGLARLISKS
ncbi:MAG: hypothetical protein OXU45_07540 [Candidatus Melainabacteria bacterium]|nr:hypothetical protein [Candidatus Melainabacteria bacterium]